MKKLWALLLAVGLLLTLTACGEQPFSKKDLYFRWQADRFFESATVTDNLKELGFDEKEIALIDTSSLAVVETVEFKEDGTYVYGYDKPASQVHARTFLSALFETLYDHRVDLADVYGEEISECESAAEFKEFYAYIFGFDSYDALLEDLVDFFMDPDVLDRPTETGTFSANENQLYLTEDGQETPLSVAFTLKGDQLTLTYKDDVQLVYTKML